MCGGLHLNPSLALAEVHRGVTATTATLSTAEEEEKPAKQQQGEDQAGGSLLPGARLTGRLNSNVDVVVGEQLEQILIGSEIHLGPTTVVLHDLSCTAIRRQQHPADLILLNTLHKIAVPQRASLRLRTAATSKESRSDHNDRQHQQGPEADVSPTLVQGSSASDEGMLIGT